MNVFEKIICWLRSIFGFNTVDSSRLLEAFKDPDEIHIDPHDATIIEAEFEEVPEPKVCVGKQSVLSMYYLLKQEIEVFMAFFPEKYKYFMDKIAESERTYHASIDEINHSLLTTALHPEDSPMKRVEVELIQDEIEEFINTEVKAFLAEHKLMVFIAKMNLLYNVTIKHNKVPDKQKAIKQLMHAKETLRSLVDEIVNISYIWKNMHLAERMLELKAYADFTLFKIELRNSDAESQELLEELASSNKFGGFEYAQSFKAFLEDELSDLSELISNVNNATLNRRTQKELLDLYRKLINAEEFIDILTDDAFWREYMRLESFVIGFLVQNGFGSDIAKIRILKRLNIDVKEDDIVISAKVNAYISLMDVWHETGDDKVFVFIKFVEKLRDSVNYKDLYFIAVLFDTVSILCSHPNGLTVYMNKYHDKFHYTQAEICGKKASIQAGFGAKYALAFECIDELITNTVEKTLKALMLDYKVLNNDIYINTLYFAGIDNVINSFTSYLNY